MKQSTRILAYSALALVVMLAAFGAIAFDTSNVAYAQGTVPAAPTLTADSMGPTTIDLTWNAVPGAARYELWAWDKDTEWQQLDDGSLTATSHSHSPVLPAAPPTTTRSAASTPKVSLAAGPTASTRSPAMRPTRPRLRPPPATSRSQSPGPQ